MPHTSNQREIKYRGAVPNRILVTDFKFAQMKREQTDLAVQGKPGVKKSQFAASEGFILV